MPYADRKKRLEYALAYRRVHAERIRDLCRAWRARNPERVKELQRARDKRYRENNPGAAKAKAQRYIKNHPEREKLRQRRYRVENPEIIRAKKHRRRARELSCIGKFTAEEWENVKQKFGHRCLCCGKSGKLQPDHVVPLACGGANTIENIQPLCGHCNSSKGAKTIDYRGER